MASSGPNGLEDVFLLTIFYVYGLVGIVVEMRDEWAVRGWRWRTMACVATRMSSERGKGVTESPIGRGGRVCQYAVVSE